MLVTTIHKKPGRIMKIKKRSPPPFPPVLILPLRWPFSYVSNSSVKHVLIQVTLTLFLFHRVYFFLSLSCYRYSYCICEYLLFMVSGVKDNSADYLQNHYDHVDHLPFVRITCGGRFADANFLTDGDECRVYDTKLNANLFFPHPLHCQLHLTPLYLTRLTLQGRPYWSPSRRYKMALVPLLWPTLYLPAQRRNRYSPLIRK